MENEGRSRRLTMILLLAAFGATLTILVACAATPEFDVTPTPTRTPRPTETPIPPTPTPTPTPAWPVTLHVAPDLPPEVQTQAAALTTDAAEWFSPSGDPTGADVAIRLAPADEASTELGTWVYALVAPFPALTDDVAWADVAAAWSGETVTPTLPFAGRPLMMTGETRSTLASLLGPPAEGAVSILPADQLLDAAWANQPAWAIVPFHDLQPRWKVLRVDGHSPLDDGLDLSAYPLVVHIETAGVERGVAQVTELLGTGLTNRDEERLSIVVMTGVTALTRGTGRAMNSYGVTFPAQDIGDWLRSADLTHISNEVSFTPDCPESLPEGTMRFCSREEYIGLLEDVGTDIVELTGNHNNDYGIEPNLHTLDLFRQRGWGWFGGGANLADATRPLTVTLGPNRLAFLGCNSFDPPTSIALAREDTPGARPCGDWQAIQAQITALRADGWMPIVTVQAYETYEYFPIPSQVSSFQSLAEAGAVIVQGSQAHQPQSFDFHAGAFIHYGLGNLFFDQMWSLGTRQEFIDRHVFYDGRYLGLELQTAMLEDYARPRPMMDAERRELLEATFAVSGWEE